MAGGCREVAGTMVLGGATSKIRQQALISLCGQSRHSRPVVEGEDVSVSEQQVGSGEGPLQSPLWQSLSPPGPGRRQALKSKSPGPPSPQPGRASREGRITAHGAGRHCTSRKQPHPAIQGIPGSAGRPSPCLQNSEFAPAATYESRAPEPFAGELTPGKL